MSIYNESIRIQKALHEYNITSLPSVIINNDKEDNQSLLQSLKMKMENIVFNDISYPIHLSKDKNISEEQATTLRQHALEYYENGQINLSQILLSHLLDNYPNDLKGNYNAGVIWQSRGYANLAIPLFFNVLLQNTNDVTVHSILQSVLFPIEPSLVLRGYENLILENPKDVLSLHALSALRGDDVKEANDEYVKIVFDGLADEFNEKLVDHLCYKIPWILKQMVQKCIGKERLIDWTILDLGLNLFVLKIPNRIYLYLNM